MSVGNEQYKQYTMYTLHIIHCIMCILYIVYICYSKNDRKEADFEETIDMFSSGIIRESAKNKLLQPIKNLATASSSSPRLPGTGICQVLIVLFSL